MRDETEVEDPNQVLIDKATLARDIVARLVEIPGTYGEAAKLLKIDTKDVLAIFAADLGRFSVGELRRHLRRVEKNLKK